MNLKANRTSIKRFKNMTMPSALATMSLSQPFRVSLNGEPQESASHDTSKSTRFNSALPGRSITIIQKNENNINLTAQNGCIISQSSFIHDIAKAIIATGCTALAIATSYVGARTFQPEILKQGLQTFNRFFNLIN